MEYYIAHFMDGVDYFMLGGPSLHGVEAYFIIVETFFLLLWTWRIILLRYIIIISFVDIVFLLPWSVSLFSPIILLLEGETTCICPWYLYLSMVLAPSIHPWYSHIVLRGLSYYKN